MTRRTLIVALALVLSGPAAAAKDLGARGETFRIGERDILEMLGAKLAAAAKSGKMQELNAQFAARVKRRLERPSPVAGLVRTQTPRSWLFDPSIVVPETFRDPAGRVFARRGDRLNPLERMPGYDRELVFIDGDDPKQVALGLARIKAGGQERVRVILTSGAPLDVMRRHKTPFYFDQEGKLSAHFGLRQVPALIVREGSRLRISEVRP